MAVTITRTAMTDDDGSLTTGTIFNNAWKTALYDQIDTALALLLPLAGDTMTGNLTISNTAPRLQLTDTTASAKSLRLDVDANKAHFYEAAGSAGQILSMDLANNRVGIGTASPSSLFQVAGTTRLAAGTGNVQINMDGYDLLKWSGTTVSFGGFTGAQWTAIQFATSGSTRMTLTAGLELGAPTGGDKGAGTINTAGDIYKNNSAYNNPHGGFEYAYIGRLGRYADRMAAMGISDYQGWTLQQLEAYTREHLHFPYFADEEQNGLFGGSERHLLMTEVLAVGVFDLAHRVAALEGQHGR